MIDLKSLFIYFFVKRKRGCSTKESLPKNGGVPEWLKGMVSKTIVVSSYREFESHPLRHLKL